MVVRPESHFPAIYCNQANAFRSSCHAEPRQRETIWPFQALLPRQDRRRARQDLQRRPNPNTKLAGRISATYRSLKGARTLMWTGHKVNRFTLLFREQTVVRAEP